MSEQQLHTSAFRHSNYYGCELKALAPLTATGKTQGDLFTATGEDCQSPISHGRSITGFGSGKTPEAMAEELAVFQDEHSKVQVEVNERLTNRLAPELGRLIMPETVEDQQLRDAVAGAEFDGLAPLPDFEQ